jgi:CheY-like chemotaxis protein
MPVCDGFQATRRIRELETSEKRKHTPIVAMTAHAMCGDGDCCIALGMDFYISKPLKAKKLQGLIQVIGMQGPYTNPSIW